HLDALIQAELLEHLARLSAQPVAEEDVPAVVPVKSVLRKSVRIPPQPGVLFSKEHTQTGLCEAVGAGEPAGAGADHDRVELRAARGCGWCRWGAGRDCHRSVLLPRVPGPFARDCRTCDAGSRAEVLGYVGIKGAW